MILLSDTSTGAMTKRMPRKSEQISADQVKGMAPYAWYILTVALKDVNGKALADDSDPDSPCGLRAGIYLITCVVLGLTVQGSKLATNWSHMRLDFSLYA